MKTKKVLLSNYMLDICISLLLTFKIINYSLVTIMGSTDKGFLGTIFLIISIVSVIILFFKILKELMIKRTISVPIYNLLFILIVSAIYFASVDKSNLSLYEFIIYFVLSFILASRKSININRVLTMIMIISLISLTCFNKLFLVQWYGSVDMDISYSFLPTVVAAIVHLSFFYKNSQHKRFYFVLYAINFIFLVQLFLYGERGTLFCILLSLILCWLFKYNSEGKLEIRKLSLKLVILMLVSFFALLFYKEILSFIVYITNIDSYAINKFIHMSSTDVSNGRFSIYQLALNGFINHPIFGNGIASFKYHTGIIYVHNILFQILYDGGLVLFLSFLFIFIRGTKSVFNNKSRDLIPFWIYLFPTSIVYLSFSNDIWFVPALWVFMGFLSENIHINNKR